MGYPTFGELGTQSFGSLTLTSSGNSGSLNLASSSIADLALASLSALAGSVYGDGSSGGGTDPTPSGHPLFKPIWITSSGLNSLNQVAGQFIVVTDTGDVYVDTLTSRLHLTNTSLVPKFQGSANAGKFLAINSSGQVVPTSLPVYNGEVT